ncbi:helix-turn-helix transcriptional regulator [Thiolapillus brandeum]|uniref:Transcriptional regulator, XRE family n=1 Tax=Thiolapillus brandeum TaxID=1076588 RepID=A0A7U6GHT9_9GAMM|nr:helix-turn-helix transcriptional regulator [Thiolapillus brandeum]BAO43874.1 transcriptional regulator, XRE family [Thiolapillus brandeum]
MNVPIPAKIRQARKLAGLTQAELAKQVGVAQKTISRIESGQDERLNAIIPLILDIAKATGVSFQQLIGCQSRPDVKAIIEDPGSPSGLRELARDNALRESMSVTDDDIASLATINLDGRISKNGYIQLLIAIRAVTGK